jgi:hypothetical protein
MPAGWILFVILRCATLIRDLQAFALEHPEANHSVPALARRVAMSPR